MINDCKYRYIIYIVISICIIIGVFITWEFTVDDAFITFRYSKHLANGFGVVWDTENPTKVEGYVNFLWMILLVIPEKLRLSTPIFAKTLGVLSLFICSIILFEYSYRKTKNLFIAIFLVVGLLGSPITYFHAVSGLETTLYCTLVLSLFIISLELVYFKNSSPALIISLPFLILLTGLCRSEGLLPGFVVIVAVYSGLNGKSRGKFLKSLIMLLIIPGFIYFIWRWNYFGWILPNVFYVKVGHFSKGMFWLLNTLIKINVVMLSILLSYYFISKNEILIKKSYRYFLIFFFVSIMPYSLSKLMMDYADRFLYHLLPVLLLMMGFCLHHLLFEMDNRMTFYIKSVICLLILLPIVFYHPDKIGYYGLYGPNLNRCHVYLGKLLNNLSIPNSYRSLAVGDAGAIPYYSDWDSLDFIGLNDERIAHGGDPAERILIRKPTIVIIYSKDGINPIKKQFGLEIDKIELQYNFIGSIKWNPNYFLLIYIRKDTPQDIYGKIKKSVFEVSEISNANEDSSLMLFLMNVRKRLYLLKSIY